MARTSRQAKASAEATKAALGVLPAPETISKDAQAVWSAITNAVPHGHFAACDTDLLAAYCTAVAITNDLARAVETDPVAVAMNNPKLMAAYQNGLSRLASLAGKLRVCPSTRNPRADVRAGTSYGDVPQQDVDDDFFGA